jgi:uncharacterized membrane protein YphA (DoxX/SURF4 family)
MESTDMNRAYRLLRIVYGAVPIVAGLDKFTNLLTDWEKYLSPIVRGIVPATAFMHAIGVIEIAAGLLVLSKFTRIGAYVVAAWLVGIALNLLTTGQYFDVAVRDLVMAAGAFTLAQLAAAREHSAAPEHASAGRLGSAPA